MWGSWHAEVPPTGPTGDAALDLRLADAFRMMIYLGDHRSRQKWIEREIAATPSPEGLPTPYQAVLARWWLDFYADRNACATCAGAGRIVLRNPDPIVGPCPECRPRLRFERTAPSDRNKGIRIVRQ